MSRKPPPASAPPAFDWRVALSLLPTPLLLFVSSAIPLYLTNQSELNHQPSALLAFAACAAAAYLAGGVCWLASRTWRRPLPIWLYYLAGPALLAYSLGRGLAPLQLESGPGFAAYLLLWLALAVALAGWLHLAQAVRFFAVLGVLLALADGARLLLGLERPEPDARVAQDDFGLPDNGGALPNIYHLIFDEYQSDYFAEQIDQRLKAELAGFTFYPNATTLYSLTNWSVPSVFLGEEYDFLQSPLDYRRRAFNSQDSFLATLRAADYSTLAIIRKLYPFKLEQFDITVDHGANIDSSAVFGYGDALVGLWIFRVAPRFLSAWLAERGIFLDVLLLDNLTHGTLLASSAAQESLLSYRKFLRQERLLAGRGRYTFLHLMLPHGAYVYGPDCEPVTDSMIDQQARCATLLLSELVAELKRLGRFRESLIVVHGDHGSRYELRDGRWVLGKQPWRSPRSLLLIKPAGVGAERLLTSDPGNVSLVDLASGMRSFVDHASGNSPRPPWWDSATELGEHVRRYYTYAGNNQFKRFRIEGEQLVLEKTLPIAVSAASEDRPEDAVPFIPVNTVVEAEDGWLSSATEVADKFPGSSGQHVHAGSKAYRFELSENARVHVEVRAITPNANGNACLLRIDDQRAALWNMPVARTWRWMASKRHWELPSGTHTLSIEYYEPIYIDQIKVVAAPAAGAGR